ncbi:MAG: xanthine dehydrogenase family protein molybdopterin-binding subunit [Reyranella sp.]|jgi:carbon-monoxide dehydrogenase large subunit|uniref:xanthine dehydrogenase family protein molybdopterin-binding subunit n=1 Tax=Reyranella sp. TaxID=1929291 RepID=UPI0009620FDB|nr:xanthine dehydrogenase family protein molybdopterin-binding subunit [Reyranella sp.]MBN9537773.1 xanthine dehydrogenase family protein molybdopterin-binding subunit [Alphaproteobacteria bacterium]MBR2817734.1 xanthine dehydrogenase family protein molybdopterin-binding subunit [Reyranella sp.]OJU36735.1 MAG: carbon monoxide dehydrogenase [Alphaproteobacteria bacterium 65-37]
MDSFDDTGLAFVKFGVGQSVARTEDPILLRGEGRYTDDINLAGQAHAVMVRSRIAHGLLKGIDTKAALVLPGVLAILTNDDLEAAGFNPLKCPMNIPQRDGSPMKTPVRPSLAKGKVRFVGEAVACVVAETALQAKDAAEAVELDIEELPAVTTPAAALAEGAAEIHDDAPGNLVLDFHYGNAEVVAKAFAEAAHVTRLEIESNRVVVNPMEPRSAIGSWDAVNERWVLNVGCQGVFGLRGGLAGVLNVKPDRLHVLTGNVGGSFGMKAPPYPEYAPLLLAAKRLGRPVKWTDERSESFLSDHHGRDHQRVAELALDKDGHFLAVRLSGTGNAGAYIYPPMPATTNAVKNVIDVYKTPAMEVNSKIAFTNTTPIAAYRGAGRPEGNYYMERLIDTAAREMGIDRVELRRRNHIAPEAMPYKAPSGMNYDSGEFTAILDEALKVADWDGFAARQAESRARGKLRGRGIGSYLEVTAPAGKEYGGIRFEADGTVTMLSGTLDYGQGHASPFAQVLTEKLGIPFDRFRLMQGDSDQLLAGGGTGGSRSAIVGSEAFLEAGAKVIEQGKAIAAHVLEAATVDIEFDRGRFRIAGTDRSVGLLELAAKLRDGMTLPEDLPQTLDVKHISDTPPSAFPNGCHIAEVEIDPDTGQIDVVRYFMVNDFGTLINPMLVEGQAHGGVVQGIGQAIYEHTIYDEQGQPVAGTFMDYALPRASDAPSFSIISHPVPCKTNSLGVKGCGEAGCAGALPSVMNAIVDALSERGVTHIDMPVTPEKVWQVLNGG